MQPDTVALLDLLRRTPQQHAASTDLPPGLLDRLAALPNAPPPDPIPDTPSSIGPYRVTGLVGRGGMGVVYAAIDPTLGRPVAVKVMTAGRFADPAARERFRREGEAVARLRHDHVVPVYAAAAPPDSPPYLVMPLVDGPTLAQTVRVGDGLSPRRVAEYARQVADALAAAHAAGLVHRDVKPSNILLDRTDGRAKLTDFGLARGLEPGTTVTADRGLGGTPEYLAPEQAADPAGVDPRSDVYSLGVTLYECLTGVVPFRGALREVLDRHAAEEPVPPRRLNAQVPADLNTICLKCLEKSPARRYASAAALRDDLDRWLTGRPVMARPLGGVGRAWRWGRRNPVAVALLAVFVVGAVTSAIGWRRAADRARDAERATQAEADQRQRAEDHLTTARDAVDRFYTRILNDGLLNDPKYQPQRQELPTDAARFYEKMLAREEADDALCEAAIRTTDRLGGIYRALGRVADEERAQLRAQVLTREVYTRNPTSPTAREALFRTTVDLRAFYFRCGQFERAASFDDEVIAMATENVRLDPNNDDARRNLAAMHANRANLWFVKGDRASAKRAYQAAFELFSELVRRRPESFVFQMDLARSQFNLGCIDDDWRTHWPEAFRRRQTLLEKQEGNTMLTQEVVKNGVLLTKHHVLAGQFAEASATATATIRVAKRYLKDVSNDIEIKHGLAESLSYHAHSLHQLNRSDEAVAAFREAEEVQDQLWATDAARYGDDILGHAGAYLQCLIDLKRTPQIKPFVDKYLPRLAEREKATDLPPASRANHERLRRLFDQWNTP